MLLCDTQHSQTLVFSSCSRKHMVETCGCCKLPCCAFWSSGTWDTYVLTCKTKKFCFELCGVDVACSFPHAWAGHRVSWLKHFLGWKHRLQRSRPLMPACSSFPRALHPLCVEVLKWAASEFFSLSFACPSLQRLWGWGERGQKITFQVHCESLQVKPFPTLKY